MTEKGEMQMQKSITVKTNWTDHDISALVQRIEDLEGENACEWPTPTYHVWQFNDGVWKCKHCTATRICESQQREPK